MRKYPLCKEILRTVVTMKPFAKVGSFVLAVVMILTTLVAAGCTPISLNKEWSYKTDDNKLDIGVYIYSLYSAYSQAQSYASDQIKDFNANDDKWLGQKFKDDDGNEMVAREWIKAEAEKQCKIYLALDAQLKEEGIELTGSTLDTAKENGKTEWEMGPQQYVAMGYFMPMKDILEPFGVSVESYTYCTSIYSTKYQMLFNALYEEGGKKAVSDDELSKFFTENYMAYSYFKVNLTESTADESGQPKTVALPDADVKKLTDKMDSYAKMLNGGTGFDDVTKLAKEALSVADTDIVKDKVEPEKSATLGDELKKAYGELKAGEAKTVKVGEKDAAVYYVVCRNDINNEVKNYVGNKANRSTVLANMKAEELQKDLKDIAKDFKCEANTSVLDQYKPDMFFKKSDESSSSSSSESSKK